jgi:exonuclease SbcC
LEQTAIDAETVWEGALNEANSAKEHCKTLGESLRRIEELGADYEALEKDYSVIALLSDTASGRGMTFQRYVLGVFLDEVLVAATRRLLEMSRGRYRLHAATGTADGRRVGGLDVEVFDEFTGLDRPASTLSGGEGFLASLALALGLAEVVQSFSGGIRLDTVFIDEGFGSLDPEALDAAIETLLGLREHGRLVGVISHVPELRERIDCRLEVQPTPRGSTVTLVVP